MKQNKRTFYHLIFEAFWKSPVNQISTALIVFALLIALFAPLIANDKPYYYNDPVQGMTFPILEDLPLIGNYFIYPEYRDTNFRKLNNNPDESLLLPMIPYSPSEFDLDQILIGPSLEHLMGTDDQGRDVASRMIYGAQVSLSVGFIAVFLYVIIGIFVGAIAGYFGGWVDLVISRIIEIIMCFPTFFLILTVLAFVGPSLVNIMVVIGLTSWTGIARLVRGEFLKLRQQDFVLSAEALGMKSGRIIFRHIFPNALSPVMVSITFGVASSILIESSLSFLGFGVQPPTPSWGQILSQSREFMDIAWWLMLYPGLAIFIVITAFNLVGEGLRDAVDPRS